MGKERGTNFDVTVKDAASVPAYHSIGGQQTGQLKINGQVIDTSSKEDGEWGTSLPGPKSMSVTFGGVAKWPDTTGLDVLREIIETANANADCEIILNSSGAKYQAEFAITDYTIDGPHAGATTYSVTMQNVTVPVYTPGS